MCIYSQYRTQVGEGDGEGEGGGEGEGKGKGEGEGKCETDIDVIDTTCNKQDYCYILPIDC